MKKNHLLLLYSLIFSTAIANAQTSWNCGVDGNNVTATLSGSTLTISGTGAMIDFDYSPTLSTAPWIGYRANIATVVVEEGVTSIGNYAFASLNNLISVTISESVLSIGEWAFRNCARLSSIAIPDGVTSIRDFAFYGATGLTSLTIGRGLTSIGDYVFYDCSSLNAVTVAGNNTTYSSENGVLFDRYKSILILYPAARQGTAYTIPATVTRIEDFAFYGNSNLTSITLENNMGSIGNLAFADSRALARVTIGTFVISIGYGAFSNCDFLTTIDVVANNNFFSAESGVLFDKNKDTLMQYPAGKRGATYSMPNSVKFVDSEAFAGNRILTSVIIGSQVTFIGGWVFDGCSALRSIICLAAEPPQTSMFAFEGISSSCCLYVWPDYLDDYLAADVWKDFNCVEAAPESVNLKNALWESDVKIYPNPFTDVLYIADTKGGTLQVLNRNGIVVHSQNVTNSIATVCLQHLPVGMYVLRLDDSEATRIAKVVKQ